MVINNYNMEWFIVSLSSIIKLFLLFLLHRQISSSLFCPSIIKFKLASLFYLVLSLLSNDSNSHNSFLYCSFFISPIKCYGIISIWHITVTLSVSGYQMLLSSRKTIPSFYESVLLYILLL